MNREVSRSIAKSGSFVIRSDSLHPENEFETVPMRTAEDETNAEDLDIRPHYAFRAVCEVNTRRGSRAVARLTC